MKGLDNLNLQHPRWLGQMSGALTRAQVVLGFSDSSEHIQDTAPHIDSGIWVA